MPQHLKERLYQPFALLLERRLQSRAADAPPLVVSLGGLPGTGKSTFVRACSELLQQRFGRRVCGFSLDDVYLTQVERVELARSTHPLLEFRGVPGTHDLELAFATLERLMTLSGDESVAVPRFDKLRDERATEPEWPVVRGRQHVVFLDAWFWGTLPGSAETLATALNERERREDPDGRYRAHVRAALAGRYQELFARSQLHVHLLAPNHEASVRWRIEQGRNEALARGLDPAEVDPLRVRRFLELFERVGGWPRAPRAEIVVHLGEAHLPTEIAPTPELADEWARAQSASA